MVPPSWIVECLKSIGVNEEIIVFMKECMKSWRVELTSGSDVLGEVKINRGKIPGGFVIAIIVYNSAAAPYKYSTRV